MASWRHARCSTLKSVGKIEVVLMKRATRPVCAVPTAMVAVWAVATLMCVLLIGCSGRRDNEWVRSIRAREANLPSTRQIGSAEAAFLADVPAAMLGPVTPSDDASYLSLSIGSDSPIECAFYYDEVEAASTLRMLAEQVFDDLAARNGFPVERSVERIDAGAIAGSPFLSVDWQYQMQRGVGEIVGELRQMIASREGRSIYCVHHENGYAASFERVFRALIASLRFSSYDKLRPYFTQLDEASVSGDIIGYTSTSLTVEEDGDPRIVRYSARLSRRGDGRLSARDVTKVEHTTLDGAVRGALFTDFRDGELVSSLLLEDMNGVAWQVSGQHDGKDVRAIFEAVALSSWLADARVFRELMTAPGDGRVTRLNGWAPERIWDAAVERDLRVVDRSQGGEPQVAALAVNGVERALVIDAVGLVQSAVIPELGNEVLRRRISLDGALR